MSTSLLAADLAAAAAAVLLTQRLSAQCFLTEQHAPPCAKQGL